MDIILRLLIYCTIIIHMINGFMSTAKEEERLCARRFISFTILLDAKEQVSTEIHTMYPVERYTPIPHDL